MLAVVRRQAVFRRRRRRRRTVGGAGIALAILAIVGLSVALAAPGGYQRQIRVVGRPTSTTATTPPTTAVVTEPTTSTALAPVARPTLTTSTTLHPRPRARIAYATSDATPPYVQTIHTVDPVRGGDQVAVRDGGSPAWSPDHTKLAFTRRTMAGANQLYVANADGTGERLVMAGDPNAEGPGNPTWSPDGREIAFIGMPVLYGGTSVGQVAIVEADGTRPRRLTNEQAQFSTPAWSPDGRHLVFVTSDVTSQGAPSRIDVINVDGTGRATLATVPGQVWSPAWSPDGRSIAFTGTGNFSGRGEIYVMNSDGTGIRALTAGPAANEDPAWSPDGTQIAFDSDRDFSYAQEHPSNVSAVYLLTKIYVMNADGSAARRVTDGSQDMTPAWR